MIYSLLPFTLLSSLSQLYRVYATATDTDFSETDRSELDIENYYSAESSIASDDEESGEDIVVDNGNDSNDEDDDQDEDDDIDDVYSCTIPLPSKPSI